MSKKFIVRLRKGGVAGNIVANSQIITIDPLTGDKIFPSNFTDLRLQGKLTTTDRVSNFTKTIIPKPTTTTTTTSTTTTTTTTAAPGSIITPPISGTNTTTTTTQGQLFSLAVAPSNITAGDTMVVTVTHRNYTADLWLYILLKSFPDINSNSLRPGPQDIISHNFIQSDQFIQYIFYKFTPHSSGQTTINIEFNKPLAWLIKDLTMLMTLQNVQDPSQKYEKARTSFALLYKTSPYSIDVINNSYTKAQQTYIDKSVEINPGDAMQVKIYGLTVGESYALAMEHTYGQSKKSHNFDKNWFTINYNDRFTNNTEWTSGQYFVNDQYPSPYTRTGTFDKLIYYYMPFTATATTHIVQIPVSAVDYVKKHFYESTVEVLDSYKFSFFLTTFDGKSHFNLNSAIKDSDGTSRYNSVVIRSKYPLFTLRKDESIERIAEGSNEKAIFYLKANRDLRASELPYKLILNFYKFQFATPIYSDVYTSTSFTVTFEGATGNFNAAYSNSNFVVVISTPVPLTVERKIEINANTLPGIGPDVVVLRIMGFPTALEGSIDKTKWLTGEENRDVYDSKPFTVIDPGNAASTKPVTVSNEVITRLRDEGGDQQEFRFKITSANWQTLVNGEVNSDVYINGQFHYRNPVSSPRGTTLIAYNTTTLGFLSGFPATYDTHLASYETEINTLLNGIGSGNLLVMYSRDAFTLFQSTRNILNSKFGGTSTFIHEVTRGPTGRYGWIFVGYADVRTGPTVEERGQLEVDNPVIVNYTVVTGNTQKNEFKYTFDLTSTASTTVYWKIDGVNINAGDFTGPTNGNFSVNGTTKCTVLATIKADKTTEGDEVFSVKLYTSEDPGALPFHNSQTVTITDSSKGSAATTIVSESVQIEPKNVYWRDEPVTFIISGGVRNTTVIILAPNAGELLTVTLDTNGAWSGPVELYGEAIDTPITITFRFANGVVKEVPVTLIYRASGGSGAGCPDPDTPINISLTETVRAGDLKPGDMIYTMHEQTLEYGYYAVLQADLEEQPKLLLGFDNHTTIIVSNSHKFLLESGEYVTVWDLKAGARLQTMNGIVTLEKFTKLGRGAVIKFEIDQAHTYIANGFISHNVKGDDRKSMNLQ